MSPEYFTVWETALKQVDYLNLYNVGDGVKGQPYDDWAHAVIPPGMERPPSGDPAPGQIGQWTVDFNNGTTGMNCGLVQSWRKKYGDVTAAQYLRDVAKSPESA